MSGEPEKNARRNGGRRAGAGRPRLGNVRVSISLPADLAVRVKAARREAIVEALGRIANEPPAESEAVKVDRIKTALDAMERRAAAETNARSRKEPK